MELQCPTRKVIKNATVAWKEAVCVEQQQVDGEVSRHLQEKDGLSRCGGQAGHVTDVGWVKAYTNPPFQPPIHGEHLRLEGFWKLVHTRSNATARSRVEKEEGSMVPWPVR